MEKIFGKIKNAFSNTYAKFAILNSFQKQVHAIFAAKNVQQNKEECQEKTMKQDYVNVEKNSPLINIRSKIIAQDCVVSVSDLNINLPVYNLEVEDNHTYFANEILVHNCLYAYAEAHHHRIKEEPKELDLNETVIDKFMKKLEGKKNKIDIPRDDGFSW